MIVHDDDDDDDDDVYLATQWRGWHGTSSCSMGVD